MGAVVDVAVALINNPRILQWVISAILSLMGVGGYQWHETSEEAKVYKDTTAIYATEAARQHNQIVKHTETKTTIIKSDCSKCDLIESRVIKLESEQERWHGR